MPHQSRPAAAEEVPSHTSYGQVIEYIQGPSTRSTHDMPEATTADGGSLLPDDITNMSVLHYSDRLYLASYTHSPDENTPFPYPAKSSRSPSKRSARAQNGPQAVPSGGLKLPPYYFSIDRSLLYNAFHADFGPLHIGHLYRFAVQLHDVLGHPDNEDRAVVFWSHADSRSESPATATPCGFTTY